MHSLGIEPMTLVLLALSHNSYGQLFMTLLILLRCFMSFWRLKYPVPIEHNSVFHFFSGLGSGSIFPIGIFKKSSLKSCNHKPNQTKLQGCELNGFNERKDCNPMKQWYNQIKNNREIKAIYLKIVTMYLEPMYFTFTAKNAFIFGQLQSFLRVGGCFGVIYLSLVGDFFVESCLTVFIAWL